MLHHFRGNAANFVQQSIKSVKCLLEHIYVQPKGEGESGEQTISYGDLWVSPESSGF